MYRYSIPIVRLRCFVLDKYEIFSGLRIVKTKAYDYAIIYMSVPIIPLLQSKYRREDIANVGNFGKLTKWIRK